MYGFLTKYVDELLGENREKIVLKASQILECIPAKGDDSIFKITGETPEYFVLDIPGGIFEGLLSGIPGVIAGGIPGNTPGRIPGRIHRKF